LTGGGKFEVGGDFHGGVAGAIVERGPTGQPRKHFVSGEISCAGADVEVDDGFARVNARRGAREIGQVFAMQTEQLLFGPREIVRLIGFSLVRPDVETGFGFIDRGIRTRKRGRNDFVRRHGEIPGSADRRAEIVLEGNNDFMGAVGGEQCRHGAVNNRGGRTGFRDGSRGHRGIIQFQLDGSGIEHAAAGIINRDGETGGVPGDAGDERLLSGNGGDADIVHMLVLIRATGAPAKHKSSGAGEEAGLQPAFRSDHFVFVSDLDLAILFQVHFERLPAQFVRKTGQVRIVGTSLQRGRVFTSSVARRQGVLRNEVVIHTHADSDHVAGTAVPSVKADSQAGASAFFDEVTARFTAHGGKISKTGPRFDDRIAGARITDTEPVCRRIAVGWIADAHVHGEGERFDDQAIVEIVKNDHTGLPVDGVRD
jgi:hypothetical protein